MIPRLLGGLKPRALVKGLTLIASFAALGLALRFANLDHLLTSGWIDAEVRGQGLAGAETYLLISALLVAVGLPRQAVSFLGGYAYGVGLGSLAALAASLLGSLATFLYARLLGRSFVQARFAKSIKRMDDLLAGNAFVTVVLIRFLPVGSNVATNLAAGVSRAPLAPFAAGSAVGFLPQTFIFALLGSGVNLDPVWRTSLAVLLFLVSAVLGVALFRRFRKNDAVVDELLGDAEQD